MKRPREPMGSLENKRGDSHFCSFRFKSQMRFNKGDFNIVFWKSRIVNRFIVIYLKRVYIMNK